MKPLKILTLLAFCLTMDTYGSYREGSHKGPKESHGHSGGHGGGDHHKDHHPSNYNPAPIYDTWYYDWDKPANYAPSYIAPHPYVPANPYKPLFPENQLQPQPQAYPTTSLYLPTFTLSTDTPMVHLGEQINVTVKVEKGVPPYTVFWNYNEDADWITGTTTFTRKADHQGLVTITAVVKDLNEQISTPQKIEVIVLNPKG